MSAAPSSYPLTVEQYHRMIGAGVFRHDDRVELLEGYLVRKVTRHPPHESTISLVEGELAPLLPPSYFIRIQAAITLPDSEPEPDLTIVLGPRRRYDDHHPGPGEIALVIESADSTLQTDRTLKCRIYARSRLPIYWIVNIPERQVEVYSEPRSGKAPHYRRREVYPETVSVPVVIGTQNLGTIPVANLLPAAPAP